MSSPEAEMKMCIISVAPMPSTMARPVASRQACQVAAGRCSPAETQVASEAMS
jgi:hypothetical protein